eukprot:2386611-Pyramimonas_sp.AAC.1
MLNRTANALIPSLVRSCLEAVFTNTDTRTVMRNQIMTDAGSITLPGSSSKRDFPDHVDRAVLSHLHAQAVGLRDFITLKGGDPNTHASINIFDDASMMIAKPAKNMQCVGPLRDVLQQKFQIRKRRKGMNMSMQVLNNVARI